MTRAGDAIARLAARLREDTDPDMQLIGEWAAQGGVGDLRAFVAGCDSRRDMLDAARDKRNHAMRAAVALRWSDLPISDAARFLSKKMNEYRNGGWRADRLKDGNPYPIGSFQFFLFEALSALPRPLSTKQILRIIR